MLQDVGKVANRTEDCLPATAELDVGEVGALLDKGGEVSFGGLEVRVTVTGDYRVGDLFVNVLATTDGLGVLRLLQLLDVALGAGGVRAVEDGLESTIESIDQSEMNAPRAPFATHTKQALTATRSRSLLLSSLSGGCLLGEDWYGGVKGTRGDGHKGAGAVERAASECPVNHVEGVAGGIEVEGEIEQEGGVRIGLRLGWLRRGREMGGWDGWKWGRVACW